jgi:photosystem II stability/assembly factor-like uncharacterized protein
LTPSIDHRDNGGRIMRRIAIFALTLVLLTPMFINSAERDVTEETIEALASDVIGTWSAINNGLTNTSVTALAIDPTNTSIIYAGTKGGVFRSADWGGNWSAINSGLTNTHVWALAIDRINTSTIYAGTEGGLFKSADGGEHWSASGLTYYVDALAIDSTNTSIIYAGTTGGLFKSVDGGGDWSYCGLPEVTTLAIDPTNTSIIYAGTIGGVFKSTNGGKSWSTSCSSDLCDFSYALAIDPTNSGILYAGGALAVFKSINGGVSWIAILPTTYGLALAIDPTNPGIIYAGTWGLGVYKSTDGGKSWSAIIGGLTNIFVTALAIDPTNTSIMYAGTWGGVFKSFPSDSLSLNVSKSGMGDGIVTSDPSGIDCGSACTASYDLGTGVTLTAIPSSGSAFSGWSGACSGTVDCVVTMDSGNKSVTATFSLQGQPGVNISIAPESLNFGTINVGQSTKQTITITNQADSSSTLVGSVGTLSAPFSVVSGGGAFNLAAGQSVTVTVQFLPTTAGSASVTLSIAHNATNQSNPASISLSGIGVGKKVSAISVIPTAKDYGNVKVNKTKTASFNVKNTGKGDLFIVYSQIKGPDGSMFTITSGRGSKHLNPGAGLTIKVAFKPASTGSKSANLKITSNDSVTPTVDIPLSGTGE